MKPNDPSDNLDDLDYTDEELLDQDLGDDLGDDLGEYDENWDDSAEQDAPAKTQKKKSPLFTIIVVGVAVLIGGGILLSMGGNSANDSSAPVEIAPPSPEASAVPVDPNNLAALQDGTTVPALQDSKDTGTTAQGFMNDPTQLDQGGASPSLPDSPSMTGFADTTPAPAEPAPSAELPVPQNLPNIDQIKKAAPAVEEPAELAVVPAPASLPEITPPVVAPVSTQADPALQSKLDQVINRIDSLEKKISQTPAATNSGEIASLRIAVERLENKVAQLSDTPVVRSVPASSYSDHDDSKVVVKKSVPKKKAVPKPSTSSAKWELRSARPGEAMVGKAGQAELKTIRVGDSVVGIGQIQSISQSGGQWIVQGSTGSIKQ